MKLNELIDEVLYEYHCDICKDISVKDGEDEIVSISAKRLKDLLMCKIGMIALDKALGSSNIGISNYCDHGNYDCNCFYYEMFHERNRDFWESCGCSCFHDAAEKVADQILEILKVKENSHD